MASPTGQPSKPKKSLFRALFWGTVLVYGTKELTKGGK